MERAVIAAVLLGACATIPPGAAGVVWRPGGGVEPQTLGEGQHVVGPLSSVDVYDLRAQERDEDLVGLTADGAPVEAGASVVTFHLVAEELAQLDRQLGPRYYETVVSPVVRAMARRVLARYRAAELDSAGIRRAQDGLMALLVPALRPMHIAVDGVVFRRVLFTSPGAYAAVLDTARSEQAAIAARTDIEGAAERARRWREQALGIAAAHALVAPSLSPESLEEARRRAWDRLVTSPSTSVLVRPEGESPLLLEVPP